MNNAFESIQQGLLEAIEFAQGEKSKSVVHEIPLVDVTGLRQKLGMSQIELASLFGISLSTVQHWERGVRKPRGPALVLLNVLSKEPEAVKRALSLAT
ncbi:MAG: helix-turn-helix domain-containing protein [Ardenticatenaceae bacterium]